MVYGTQYCVHLPFYCLKFRFLLQFLTGIFALFTNKQQEQTDILAIRWHTALFHVQLGEFESALTLYDDRVGPMTLKGEQNYRFNGTVSQGFVQLSGINRKYKYVKKSRLD
jgi:hypothetical protein